MYWDKTPAVVRAGSAPRASTPPPNYNSFFTNNLAQLNFPQLCFPQILLSLSKPLIYHHHQTHATIHTLSTLPAYHPPRSYLFSPNRQTSTLSNPGSKICGGGCKLGLVTRTHPYIAVSYRFRLFSSNWALVIALAVAYSIYMGLSKLSRMTLQSPSKEHTR